MYVYIAFFFLFVFEFFLFLLSFRSDSILIITGVDFVWSKCVRVCVCEFSTTFYQSTQLTEMGTSPDPIKVGEGKAERER